MARPATGQVVERTARSGAVTFALRFRAYGKREYVTLGTKAEGWTQRKAEAELRHVLADVERGIWQPHEPEPVEAPAEAPTFHVFASEWLAAREPELRPRTITDHRWALELHLLPAFKDHRLPDITIEEVDRYKAAKLREGKLAPNAINKTLTRSPNSSGTGTRGSRSASTSARPSAGRSCRAAILKPSMRPANGHKWAQKALRHRGASISPLSAEARKAH